MMLNRQDPIYRQISMHFERQIFEGKLPEGSRIPSTSELAEEFDVNPDTIQLALSKLVERGILERRRGAGTFVRKGVKGRTAAIVFGENNFTRIDRAFFNLLLKFLAKRLTAAGWDSKHFVTTERPQADSAFQELESMVHGGSVNAVIEFCSNNMIRSWLESSCPVPFSKCEANIDYADFVEKGLGHLVKMGRKSPLVIGGRRQTLPLKAMDAAAKRVFEKAGLDPKAPRFIESSEDMKDGHRCAIEAIDSGTPFDSILSMFDSSCRGIQYALLQRSLAIPDNVALITHSNKGIELFSHIPLTRLEVDPDRLAADVVEEIGCKLDGREWKPRMTKAALVAGKSCGE